MGALPRPSLPPGPQRDLVEALHELHHRAGWPSLRVLGRHVGCSHTTVSGAFSSTKVPAWGVLELLVEAMDGDVAEFRARWLEVTDPSSGDLERQSRFVGRRTELGVVRDHLAGRTPGTLLVMGEAGMGKSRLVEAASRAASATLVWTGWCRPLSSEVPLAPVVDWLRSAHQHDDGASLAHAVGSCPPYVAVVLGRLLPELQPPDSPMGEPTPRQGADRSRLFAAIGLALTALSRERGIGLVVEDAHWGDVAALDLLEYLTARRLGAPTVVTWRSEDPATLERASQWRSRIETMPAVRVVE